MELDQVWDLPEESISVIYEEKASLLGRLGKAAYLGGVTVSFYTSNKVFAHVQEFQWLNGNGLIERRCSNDDSLSSHPGGLDH